MLRKKWLYWKILQVTPNLENSSFFPDIVTTKVFFIVFLESTLWNSTRSVLASAWNSARDNVFNMWSGANHDAALLAGGPAAHRLYGGRMNEARKQEAVTVTREAMQRLHKALETMPKETDEEEAPNGIRSKYELYGHQKEALAWLIWRETQDPPGGILADDMGLGEN